MAGVEAVAGAGEVLVEPLVVVEQPVVGGVVDAAEVQRRAQVVALGGVVVDHVEDHLDTGLVEGAHHGLELGHGGTGVLGGRVLVVRGEEPESVVSPVVSQAEIDQPVVVQELVDRHQLDGGDVERLEVVDDGGMAQTGVGAALFLGDARVGSGHALDVGLVDDRLVVRGARRVVGTPVEERVDHHAGHGVAQRVDHRRDSAGREVLGFQIVGIQRLGEVEVAVEGLAVRVEQQLAGVTAVPGGGVPGAVHPEAVALAGADGRQVGVPDEAVDLVELDACLGAVLGDQAQLDLVGHFGEQREVRAGAVVGGTERIRRAGPYRGPGGFARRHVPTLSAHAPGCAGSHHQPVAGPSCRASSGISVRM